MLIYPEEAYLDPVQDPQIIATTRQEAGEEISLQRAMMALLTGAIDSLSKDVAQLHPLTYYLAPRGALFIEETDTRTLAAAATATAISLSALDTEHGAIKWFGNELTDTSGYPNVTWWITVNGVRKGPWDAITLSLGSIAQPQAILIPLVRGDTVTVGIQNTGSISYVVRSRIGGWQW